MKTVYYIFLRRKGGIKTGKLKTAICSVNSKYVHSSLAPWCLAAGIRKYCGEEIEYKVVEGTINESPSAVLSRIAAEKPDIIGLSCYIWNIRTSRALGAELKKSLPDSIIILGGPEVSYNAKEVLSELCWCDFVVSGEGEYPFAELCSALALNKSFNIPGVCFRSESKIVVKEPFISREEPPTPYCEEYFAALGGRIAYLETSRGCPYSCAFCLSGRCGSARFFNLDRAKREILLLAQSGAKTIKLVDRTFNAEKERSKELFRFIISEHGKGIPKDVCFHFELAGDILDEESIAVLNGAPRGSMQLEIGLQSFNEKTLAYINRKTNTKKLSENIKKLTAPKNIHVHIDLIAGLPFEDLESFAESFNKAYALAPNMLQLGFLKLLHGAAMREDSEKYPCVFSSEPPYEVISTEWTNEAALARLHCVEDALERLYNSGRFAKTLDYVLAASGKTLFEIFLGFGEWVAKRMDYKISLDDYIALAYEYFPVLNGINPAVLKDMMICDRVASNASGKLPPVLKVPVGGAKQIRLEIESREEFKRPAGIKRGFAFLQSENAAIIADYKEKDPVTGLYEIKKAYY